MKVLITALLCLVLSIQSLATAQDSTTTNGISKISGMDVIVVEEPLDTIFYNSELQELNLSSEHADLTLEGWYEDWMVALSGLVGLDETFEIDPQAQTLNIDLSSNIIMKSQGQFRMSGPFEMISFYLQDATKDSTETVLSEDSFFAFIGNDIPLKLTLLPELETKITAQGVVDGKLELKFNDQSYLVSPNEVTPLADNFCTYLIALNESLSSDIMGNKTTEWRFDIALYKCNDFVIL